MLQKDTGGSSAFGWGQSQSEFGTTGQSQSSFAGQGAGQTTGGGNF